MLMGVHRVEGDLGSSRHKGCELAGIHVCLPFLSKAERILRVTFSFSAGSLEERMLLCEVS
jgi:hypothetical protein